MLSPKQIVAAERSNRRKSASFYNLDINEYNEESGNLILSPSSPLSANAAESPESGLERAQSMRGIAMDGLQGILIKDVDNHATSLSETHQRVFVTLADSKLMFSAAIPSNISETTYITNESGKNCLGYVNLTPTSTVSIKNLHGSVTQSKKFPFIVEDSEVAITLTADTTIIRDLWMDAIKQAIDGVKHSVENSVLVAPNGPNKGNILNKANMFSSGGRIATTDFPHKVGYLKKAPTSGMTFGLMSAKKRWFRLEGGELRYYEDEDIRQSKLKSILDLRGAKLEFDDAKSTNCYFSLELNNNKVFRLEAPNANEAQEWKDALSETLALLENLKNAKGEYHAARRFNLHENLSAVEKKAMLAHIRNGGGGAGGNSGSSGSYSLPTSPSMSAPNNNLMSNLNSLTPSAPSASSPSPSAASSPRQMLRQRPGSKLNSFNEGSSQQSPSSSALITAANHASSMSSIIGGAAVGSTFKSPHTVELLSTTLHQHFLIKQITDVTTILDRMFEKVAVPGEVILWQGTSGDLFYVLERGTCEVLRDGRKVALLHAGKSFGEMALLNSALRQATIRATELCRLWCLSRKDFREVANRHEQHKLAERLSFLRQIELFNPFMDSALERIAEVMVLKSYAAGEKIIRQGDMGDRFYMIATGRVLVTQIASFASSSIELVRLGPHKYFGELALIEDAPRKATVSATTAVTCWTVDRNNFKHLFGSLTDAVNQNLGLQALKKVKLLESLTERQLQEISKVFVAKQFVEQEVIIKQGEVGDAFYLLVSGQVSVQVNHVQVAVLEDGTFFGEMALLSNERRSATVIALSPVVKTLILSRADFTELMGPLDKLLQAEAARRSEMQVLENTRKTTGFMTRLRSSLSATMFSSTSGSNKRESSTELSGLSAVYATTNSLFQLQDLEKVRKLGVGSFGVVYLVQHQATSKLYAMKVLYKEHLFTFNQEKNAFSERDIMLLLAAESPFFMPMLYATLQDSKALYFVQQFISGGDLFNVLNNRRIMPRTKLGGVHVNTALFYASNVLAAINHMHNRDIIYRDIKPENMVLDVTGYLKLVDYGCAKVLPVSQKTETLCGTPEYLSPEMILSKSYNRSVDYWALGVFIFELLTRFTPFAHPNLIILYQNVLEPEDSLNVKFADLPGFDLNAKSIIYALLTANPNMRMGMLQNGVKDIWITPFFSSTDMDQVVRKTLTAPYIPSSDDVTSGADSYVALDTIDFIDMLEDEDTYPVYMGAYDYSGF